MSVAVNKDTYNIVYVLCNLNKGGNVWTELDLGLQGAWFSFGHPTT